MARLGVFLPSLDAKAAYQGRSDGFQSRLGATIKGWRLSAVADWNVFESFGNRGRLRSARADAATARADLEEARLLVGIDVRRTYSSLIEARELVAASSAVEAQAEEALRLARARFDADLTTQLDVLESQVALTEARANRVEAVHDQALALWRYRRAIWAE